MKVALPTCKAEIKDGKLHFEEGEIEVAFDFSVWAEERWEVNFPANAKSETLMAYIKRIVSKEAVAAGKILSYLKAIYCLIEDGEMENFKAFCKMFDLTNIEYTKKLLTKITEFLQIALSYSAVDEKN